VPDFIVPSRGALRRSSAPCLALALSGALSACSGVSGTEFDCSVQGQKAYVASIMSNYYLWYDRVPEVDYAAADSPEQLLQQMTYTELDHWSGMQRQAERTQFFDQGRFQGLGYTLGLDDAGGLRISWVHQGSAAGRAGLDRGALILGVNGLSIEDLTSAELGNELSQDVVVHRVQELDGRVHDVELRQGDVEITSVKSVTILPSARGPIGYLMFTTFVRPGEQELQDAFEQFRVAGVRGLVIDLRYNGGGLLSTAALLGSLIDAGAAGKPLIVETYNDLHPEMNRRRLMFEAPQAVDVPRVVFLVTGRTASASEQVINGLKPYLDVQVVGSRTLGKPVGADSWTHCDYAIAPITFHSLNADGAGDYFNGIEPVCAAGDDLLHPLGNPEEAQLHAALRLLDDQTCSDRADTLDNASLDNASLDNASLPDSGEASSPELRPTAVRHALSPQALPPGPIPDLLGWY
jgi:carboxyl-terminal processing protease